MTAKDAAKLRVVAGGVNITEIGPCQGMVQQATGIAALGIC